MNTASASSPTSGLKGRPENHRRPLPAQLRRLERVFEQLDWPDRRTFLKARRQARRRAIEALKGEAGGDASHTALLVAAAELFAQTRDELTLVDGSTLRGFASAELPEQHSRLLDYLNDASPFFAVSADEEFHFVNRAHVLYARPED